MKFKGELERVFIEQARNITFTPNDRGRVWYNTDLEAFVYNDGTAIVPIAGGSSGGGSSGGGGGEQEIVNVDDVYYGYPTSGSPIEFWDTSSGRYAVHRTNEWIVGKNVVITHNDGGISTFDLTLPTIMDSTQLGASRGSFRITNKSNFNINLIANEELATRFYSSSVIPPGTVALIQFFYDETGNLGFTENTAWAVTFEEVSNTTTPVRALETPTIVSIVPDGGFWTGVLVGDYPVPTHYITDADANKHYVITGNYSETGNPNDLLNFNPARILFISNNGSVTEEMTFRITNRSNTPINIGGILARWKRTNLINIEPQMSVDFHLISGFGWEVDINIVEEANFYPGLQYRVSPEGTAPGQGQISFDFSNTTIQVSLDSIPSMNVSTENFEDMFTTSVGGMLSVQSVTDYKAQRWYKITGCTITGNYATLSVQSVYRSTVNWNVTDRVNLLLVPNVYPTGIVTTLSSGGGGLQLDLATSKNFRVVLENSVSTITIFNPPLDGVIGEFDIQFTQNGTGGFTVTLPPEFKPLGQSDTAVALAPNAVTILTAKSFDGGTNWYYAMQEVV